MYGSSLQDQQQDNLLLDLLMSDDSSSMYPPWGRPGSAATAPYQQQMGQLDDAMLRGLLQPEASPASYTTRHPWTPVAAAGNSFDTAAHSSAAAQTARPSISNNSDRSGIVERRQSTRLQHLVLPAPAGGCNITAGFRPVPSAAAAASACHGGLGPSDLLLTLHQPALAAAADGAMAASVAAMPLPEVSAVQHVLQGTWGAVSIATKKPQQQQQQQQQQLLASQLSDEDWDLLLPPLPAPMLQQHQQQQAQLLQQWVGG
jgi:hypothetical protein